MENNGLILLKHLFREFSPVKGLNSSRRIGTDVPILLRCPPTMIWTLHLFSMVMCTIGVKYQHEDRVSLKHPILKETGALIHGKCTRLIITLQKCIFFLRLSSKEFPRAERTELIVSRASRRREEKGKCKKNVVGHSPYFKNHCSFSPALQFSRLSRLY